MQMFHGVYTECTEMLELYVWMSDKPSSDPLGVFSIYHTTSNYTVPRPNDTIASFGKFAGLTEFLSLEIHGLSAVYGCTT